MIETDTHRYEYRDGTEAGSAILAEFDSPDTDGSILHALIQDGHDVIRAWTDGKPALGSYRDFG